MQNIEKVLLGLQERVDQLERRLGPEDSRFFEPTSVDQVISSAQRIPVSGENYYLDFDGTGKLKSIILGEGNTWYKFGLSGTSLLLEKSEDGGETWAPKQDW